MPTVSHRPQGAQPSDPPIHLEPAEEVRQLGAAVEVAILARREAEEADALASMPLLGVLFLALAGSPGERAEIDPPLVLALHSLRRTVDGWANLPGDDGIFASVSYSDLDLMVRKLDAVVEIARRSLPKPAPVCEGGAS